MEKRFTLRKKSDETVDLICLECFLTVATIKTLRDIEQAQQRHKCDRSLYRECFGSGHYNTIKQRNSG